MQKTIKIVTYPRCGSSYLYWLLSTSFGKDILKTHLFDKELINTFSESDYIVTVLRDPIDAISSFITMESFYWRKDQTLEEYLEEKIPTRIFDYVDFYKTIIEIADLILDYKEINIFRNTVVKKISDDTLNKIVNYDYIDLVKDDKDHYFLRTSLKSEEYMYIKNKIIESDLSDCYNIYNKCKELVTSFIK